LPAVVAELRRDHRQTILLEEYIAGHEVTVGVVGNDPARVIGALAVSPMRPNDRFIYSLEVKRNYHDTVKYECPPPLPAASIAALERAALAAYDALGCRDISRVDFRLRDGVPYFLEVNPLPGLNPVDSDLVILAERSGWSYHRLIATIVQSACKRLGLPA
jgi:D-alanine-D-alanine ligase